MHLPLGLLALRLRCTAAHLNEKMGRTVTVGALVLAVEAKGEFS